MFYSTSILKLPNLRCHFTLLALAFCAWNPPPTLAQAPYGLDALAPIGKFLGGSLPSVTPDGHSNPSPPSTLSGTGVFTNLATLTPRAGLIPYDVNTPLWTDGAEKKRWIAVPNDGVADKAGEKINFDAEDSWFFPKGTVIVKQFDLPVDETNPTVLRRVETRFLVHGDDGAWFGFTYKWRADGTDADLLYAGDSASISITQAGGGTRLQTWDFPSRSDCLACHNGNAGRVLGLRTHQINRNLTYPATGRSDNQLRTLNHLGLFSPALDEAAISGYLKSVPITDASASLETKVRSYLDSNCSHCHQPGNLAVNMDARFTTPLAQQQLINAPVLYDLGVAGAKVLAPQSISQSILHHRLSVTGLHQMPPIGRNTVDTAAVNLLVSYINSLPVVPGSGQNRAPVANNDEGTSFAGAAVDLVVTSNDLDLDGDTLEVTQVANSVGGSASIVNITNVRFTPQVGFTGDASFDYIVRDPSGATDTASVLIRVLPATTANGVTLLDSSSRLSAPSWASGVAMAVADMNADGRDDIVHLREGMELRVDYQPSGTGNFTFFNLGIVSGTQRQWGLAIGDADNNGYPDILTGGYYDGLHYQRANGTGTGFTKTVLTTPSIFSQALSFADINNDGWLDIFACNDDAENAKFRNNGTGTMLADASLISTVTTPASDNSGNYGIVWSDYDNDGDLDMYLSKCRQGVTSATDPRRINKLMRNNSNGTYTEAGPAAGLAIGEQSWAADFGDIDNDGDLDCFVGNHMSASLMMRNNGDGIFTNITSASGVNVLWRVIQNVFRDFNNDGWVDLLVVGESQQLWLNDRDGTFTLLGNPFGSSIMESAAVGDLNRDGFTDIYAGYANLYNTPNTAKPDKLWLSSPNSNGFFSLTLRGVASNRTASGARIELHGPWGIQVREVRSGEGYGVTHSFTQIFGMGNAASATKVRVRWPNGSIDEALNITPGQFRSMTQGDTQAPSLANPGLQTDAAGAIASLSLSASDPTGNALSYTAQNLPNGLSLNSSTGQISGTVDAAAAGSYPVIVRVTDGWSSVQQSFTWQITAPSTPPTVALSTPQSVVTGPFQVTVTFDQAITGLVIGDFAITGGSITGLSGSGHTRTLSIIPSSNVTVQLPADTVINASSQGNLASNLLPVTYQAPDVTPPEVVLSAAAVTQSQTFTVQVVFTEEIFGLAQTDLTVTNGSVLGFSQDGWVATFTLSATATGNVTVQMPANRVNDVAGNGNLASNTITVRYDPPAPLAVKINFQPQGAPVPVGYIDDTGALFGSRNGQSYGWWADHRSRVRDRNRMEDQAADTLVEMDDGIYWEIAVPNGNYDVTAQVGDPGESSVNDLTVEGQMVFNTLRLAAGQTQSATLRVSVGDGRLSLRDTANVGLPTKLNFVQIIKVDAVPLTGGLTGAYYAGNNFQDLRFTRTDPVVDFAWADGTPDLRVPVDSYSVRWTAQLLPRYTEIYTFFLGSDEGARLWVNGQLMIDHWAAHSYGTQTGSINLQSGVPVSLQLDYYDQTGTAAVKLEWSSVSEKRQVVPQDRLTPTVAPALQYPTTFAAWLSSSRTAGGSATVNADADFASELLEYALGSPADSGVTAGEFLQVQTVSPSAVTLSARRPSGIADLTYHLEHSTDLQAWTPLPLAPNATAGSDGMTALQWANVHSAPSQSLTRGHVRLRVTGPGGITATTQPTGWQQRSLVQGIDSLAWNYVAPPLFTGSISTDVFNNITFTEPLAWSALLDADSSYYLEILTGSQAGHRWDVASYSGSTLTLNPSGVTSTQATVPSSVIGGRAALRRHVTLGEAFPKTGLVGTLNPSTADSFMFYENGAYVRYFYLKGGPTLPQYDYWALATDVNLTNQDNRIIPPGVGLMTRFAGPRTLLMASHVRTTPFVHRLIQGNNLLANPYPRDATPFGIGLTLANGFTGTRNPNTSDRLLRWSTSGTPGFTGHWLSNSNSNKYWTSMSDALLLNADNDPLMPTGSSFFLRLHLGPPTTPWVIPGLESAP